MVGGFFKKYSLVDFFSREGHIFRIFNFFITFSLKIHNFIHNPETKNLNLFRKCFIQKIPLKTDLIKNSNTFKRKISTLDRNFQHFKKFLNIFSTAVRAINNPLKTFLLSAST